MSAVAVIAHPLLWAVFPVLFLYAQNPQEVPLRDVVPLLVVVSAFACVLVGALYALLRDMARATLTASAFMVLFAFYGAFWDQMYGHQVGPVILDDDRYLLPLWIAMMAGACVAAARAREAARAGAIFTLIGALLVGNSAVTIGRSLARMDDGGAAAISPIPAAGTRAGLRPDGRPRDIYYVILDRYAGERTLRESYGFDNGPFLRDLERKGFAVAHDSLCNYPRTIDSLAASLNMRYLDFLTARMGEASDDLAPLLRSVRTPAVARFLRAQGYRTVYVGSHYDLTPRDPRPDATLSFSGISDFARALHRTTVAYPVGRMLGVDMRRDEAKRALFQFRALERTRTMRGPLFVMAHILLPHEPYVFDANGRYVSPKRAARQPERALYLDQLRFTNTTVRAMLGVLLAAPESERPIVVLQADEGPHPPSIVRAPQALDWKRVDDAGLRAKFPILNALYLPGVSREVPRSITPVNTFRLILSRYFGANLPPLPDRAFIFDDARHLYRFTDVTARVG